MDSPILAQPNQALGVFGSLPTELRDEVYRMVADNVTDVFVNNNRISYRIPPVIYRNPHLARKFISEYRGPRDVITHVKIPFNSLPQHGDWSLINYFMTRHTSPRDIVEMIREPHGSVINKDTMHWLSWRSRPGAGFNILGGFEILLRHHQGAQEIKIESKMGLGLADNGDHPICERMLIAESESWKALQQYSIRFDKHHGTWSKRNADGTWPAKQGWHFPSRKTPLEMPRDSPVFACGSAILANVGHVSWKQFLQSFGLPVKFRRQLRQERHKDAKKDARATLPLRINNAT